MLDNMFYMSLKLFQLSVKLGLQRVNFNQTVIIFSFQICQIRGGIRLRCHFGLFVLKDIHNIDKVFGNSKGIFKLSLLHNGTFVLDKVGQINVP